MFNISLELQSHALRSRLFSGSFFFLKVFFFLNSLYLLSSCVFLPEIAISCENSHQQCYSVDFKHHSSEKSLTPLLTTCCPQNFLATYTVHEPQRGLLCPITCLKAQPVSCVIINPLSPEDTQTERSLSASVHKGLCLNSQLKLTSILNAKWPPLSLVSFFIFFLFAILRRGGKNPKC